MNREARPRLARELVKESCFGTYVLNARSFKPRMLTQAATNVVKFIDGEKNVSEIIESVGALAEVDPQTALNRVKSVIDELEKMGALYYE